MVRKNRTRRKRCLEWEGNNYNEPQSPTHRNPIDILRKRNPVGIVRMKMLLRGFSARTVNCRSNWWRCSIWRIRGLRFPSSITNELLTKFPYLCIRPKRDSSKSKISTLSTWSITRFVRSSKLAINWLNKISIKWSTSWKSIISTFWMGSSISMIRRSFTKKISERIKRKTKTGLNGKGEDPEKLKSSIKIWLRTVLIAMMSRVHLIVRRSQFF